MKLLLAALLVSSLAGCGRLGGVSIDYVDFVKHDGIDYLAPFTPSGRALTDADLGPELFRVAQRLDGSGLGPEYRPRDGDAAFIPAGTPVFAVRGYASTFRIAAHHDGRLVLYEADTNPAARRGADLLDVEGKVMSIALLSQKDGRTELGRIGDPLTVRSLVALILDAPVDQSPQPTVGAIGFVRFELQDGTAVTRGYVADPGILSRGIVVAGAFRSAMKQLAATAPTATPVPAVVNLARRYDLARATSVFIKSTRGTRADAALVAPFAEALDADMPTRARGTGESDETVVGFQFADRTVSFGYLESEETLIVVAPDDVIAVRATPAFVRLLAATPLQR